MNRIDFLSKNIGVIASYKLYEMGVRNFPQAAFIYGECNCPILESSENDMVKNDRTKLNESPLSRALLNWIAEQVDSLASEIATKENKDRDKKRKEYSSALNNVLNDWKNKIMDKVVSEILSENLAEKDTKGGSKSVKSKRTLEAPENIEFSYSFANLPLDIDYPLTLKAKIPEPIPVGAIIEIKSNNRNIKPLENKVTISPDDTKLTEDKKEVAVINILVKGLKKDENGTITASVGKYKATIDVTVIEKKAGEKEKKDAFPKVLLSSFDSDPLGISPSNTVTLDPRQPLIYQRPQDIDQGIYWINTSSYLANSILTMYGDNSMRWRDYLLQRYIEIFIKEALFKLQKKEPENFNAERIDSEILGTLISNIHEKAVKDLSEFLFEENYKPNKNE